MQIINMRVISMYLYYFQANQLNLIAYEYLNV